MRVAKLYCKIALAGIVASALGVTASAQDTTADRTTVQKAKTTSAAMNEFGLKVVSNLSASRPHKNIFVSPLSVFVALAMTEKGTTGATRSGIRQALAVPHDVTEDQLQDSTSAVLSAFEAERRDGLSVANGLWSSKPLAHAFTEQCRKFYQAEVATLDLKNEVAAASRINGWVSTKTHDKIHSIVEPRALGDSSVVLTNALYFHGTWSKPFPKNITREESFHLAGGGEKKVQMMHQPELSDAYRRGEGFEAVALDYQSSHIRLYAILPQAGTSPEQGLARVASQGLQPASGERVNLYLPRFTLDFSAELNDVLKGMGMAAAFAASDDFRPMGAGKLSLGLVQHRAVLEVDEEGTTASGGTVAVLSRELPTGNTLFFDRPFAVLLCDTRTGAVLFAGVVYEPGP